MDSEGIIVKHLVKDTGDDGTVTDFTWKNEIAKMIGELKQGIADAVPIGISAPGITNSDHQWIDFMPGRLNGLEKLNWGHFLNEPFLKVINDAKAALLAEYYYGAAKGMNNSVLLTLGTGVGGAIIVNGKLYEGWLTRAGHLGHLSLHPFGDPGILNLPGTLEMAIGNVTVANRSRGKYQSTAALVEGYQSGEPWATWVWLDSVKCLAMGISSIINILSPDLIVLSGGIIQAEDSLFKPLNSYMEIFEWRPSGQVTPIVKAQFEDLAGAVGAACFARE